MEGNSLFAELQRRKVVRVMAAYLAGGLAAIYAADAILPRLGLPEWTVTLVIVLVGLGLPIAIGLSWAFDVTPGGVVRTDPEPDAPAAFPASGIVVLPFDDMSPDADSEHLCAGITEEITADLAGIGDLRVISRTSATRFKSSHHDLPSIGRELGVRYALEGSVRRAQAALRITAQLIDVETDTHLWAAKFNGTVDEVFELQERVAREVCNTLHLTLTPEEERRLADRPVEDVRAFELFVRARERLRQYSTEGVDEFLARAMEIEGETPPLRALAAWARVNEVRSGRNRDLRPLDEAELEARALLAEAPGEGYGHALMGYISYERGDQPAAVRHFEAALEIEPNDGDNLFYLGIAQNAANQLDAARQTAERMLAADPLSPMAHLLNGALQWFRGRAEESVPSFERALALDPDNVLLRWTAGYTFALIDRMTEAETQTAWLRQHAPRLPYTLQLTALVDALGGRHDEARATIAAVDLAPLDAHNAFHIAEPLAVAGDTEQALELVGRAVRDGFYPYDFLAEHCPFMEPLRGRPEYDAILSEARGRVERFGTA